MPKTNSSFSGLLPSGLTFLAPDGTFSAPGYGFTSESAGTGWYMSAAGVMNLTVGGVRNTIYTSSLTGMNSAQQFGWYSSAFASFDTIMVRTATNAVQFGTVGSSSAGGSVTSRTEMNKTVAAIADNVATAVLTVTIPNAAHSGSMRVRVTGSAGAGGAIGANEATAVNEYIISFTRTAGVNAVTTISAAYGAAASTVAGANAVTCVAAMSTVSGAVGATNTFTVNVTIARAAGSATNHTCLVYAQLMNANATGITIA